MDRRLAAGSRLAAGVVAVTLALVSSATCLAGSIDVLESQHLCCAAMADGCGSAANVTEDCCAAEQPGVTGFAPGAPFALMAPMVISTVLPAPATSIPQRTSPPFDPDASNPINQRRYLLDSVFRI